MCKITKSKVSYHFCLRNSAFDLFHTFEVMFHNSDFQAHNLDMVFNYSDLEALAFIDFDLIF